MPQRRPGFNYYLADPYNEMLPPQFDRPYLRNVSTSIYSSMATADPRAVWVAQAWFLSAAPRAPWGWDQLDAFLLGV